MIFNQTEFLFLFLPTVLAASALLKGRARVWMLIAASFVFYGAAGLSHAAVLALDIVCVYFIATSAGYEQSRWRLVAAIAIPALGLIYFKYTGLLVSSFASVSASPKSASTLTFLTGVALPAGISFFTFQLISFAVDRHRGDPKTRVNFETFALFISFFPQLVAGPIVRARDVMSRMTSIGHYRLNADDLAAGAGYFILGLALKVLIADTLARYGAAFTSDPASLSAPSAWYFVFNYSFRIYFDFYGYSLCAIGLGRMFGLQFPSNFNRPYESLNPRDFWRRWHMTLSYWIRDYLYLPLGGNRRYVINIIIVFAICGLWHGAAWTFVAWGLYHGLLVVFYSLCRRQWDRLPGLLQVALTFILISVGWALFVFDFEGVANFMASLAGQGSGEVLVSWEHLAILAVAAVVCFVPDLENAVATPSSTVRQAAVRGVGLACLMFAAFLFLDVSETFIYFRF